MPARSSKLAENRTLRDISSTNQTVLATKKFRMTKSQENAVLNILTENSCLFVVTFVPFVMKIICVNLRNLWFPFCLSVFVSWCLGGFVAMSQLCKTKPICWTLK
jgi:hypothetical protein